MTQALRIFVCYAHEDNAFRESLVRHLLPLKKRGLFEAWDDRQIAMGAPWEERLSAELERADMVLALVSPHFIGSDYALDKELARALERAERGETLVVPIIVAHCLWQEVPQLAKLEAPRKGEPPRGVDDHAAFTEIAAALRSEGLAIRARRAGAREGAKAEQEKTTSQAAARKAPEEQSLTDEEQTKDASNDALKKASDTEERRLAEKKKKERDEHLKAISAANRSEARAFRKAAERRFHQAHLRYDAVVDELPTHSGDVRRIEAETQAAIEEKALAEEEIELANRRLRRLSYAWREDRIALTILLPSVFVVLIVSLGYKYSDYSWKLEQMAQAPINEWTPFGIPPFACPESMLRVDGAAFSLGSAKGEIDEQILRKELVKSFCLNKTEVTVSAYLQCVEAKACSNIPTNPAWLRAADPACNGDKPDRLDHPMNCVTWDEANAFCKWSAAGRGRLPTEAEWEYAARGAGGPDGTEGRTYPWGNSPEPNAIQDQGKRLLNGCGAECSAYGKKMNLGSWSPMYDAHDGFPTTAPVGSFRDGDTPPPDGGNEGFRDLAGNVREWVEDAYCSSYDFQNCTSSKVLRGGSWGSGDARTVRGAHRSFDARDARASVNGFRCARDFP